jgi:hypothetical protein
MSMIGKNHRSLTQAKKRMEITSRQEFFLPKRRLHRKFFFLRALKRVWRSWRKSLQAAGMRTILMGAGVPYHCALLYHCADSFHSQTEDVNHANAAAK